MDTYRKIHISVTLCTLFVVTGSYILFDLNCSGFCRSYSMSDVFKPLFWGSLALLGVLLFLFIFRARVFSSWFKYIASWYLPVATFIVISINPYSSGVLSVDRGPVALNLMAFLGVITVIFAIGYTIVARLRK